MEKSKEYFDEIAANWDEMRSVFFPEEVRTTAYSLANIQKGKTAADIGAGTGFMTEGLLKAGLSVIAIDQSENMLNNMKEKYKDFDGLTCVAGDSDALPLDEQSVDYSFANMFLHHVVDPAKAISELYRILKPGGKLVITDLDSHDFSFLQTEQHDIWMGFQRSQVKDWFLDAGFKDVSISCVGCNCCSDSNEHDQKANISIFAAYGMK